MPMNFISQKDSILTNLNAVGYSNHRFLVFLVKTEVSAMSSNDERRTYPMISLIVPVFNEAKIISRFLDAILRQDYPNYEVIIVDGNSTDGTVELVKQYVKQHSQIRMVSEEPRKGLGNARNIGLDMSRGEIIIFEDADWIEIDTGFLRKFAESFQDSDVKMVATKRLMKFDGINLFERLFALFNAGLRTYPKWGFPGYYMAYRKGFINKVGYFEPKMGWGEDKFFLKKALSLKPKIAFGNPIHSASDIHYFEDFPKRYRFYGRTFFNYEENNPSQYTFLYLGASFYCVLTSLMLLAGLVYYPLLIYGILLSSMIVMGTWLLSLSRLKGQITGINWLLVLLLPALVLLQGLFFFVGLVEGFLHKLRKPRFSVSPL